MILVYITNPTKRVAEKIANFLLKKRLIDCANIFEVKNHYKIPCILEIKAEANEKYLNWLKSEVN